MLGGKRSILFAYGTCAEATKLAPVVRALRHSSSVHPAVAVPAQRSEVLDELHEILGIVPEIDLDMAGCGANLDHMVSRALAGHTASLERSAAYLVARGINAVVVEGNSPTALGLALVGFQAQLPVVHVEAGVRAAHGVPAPDEDDAGELIAQVASLNLVSTPLERANLLDEGVHPERIVVTGRLTIDTQMAAAGNPLGDGHAVPRARAAIEELLGVGDRLPDFIPPRAA